MDKTHGKLPTVEDIETIWELPEKPTEPVPGNNEADFEAAMANYKVDFEFFNKKMKLLTWCATDYLSMAVGVETWGLTQKCTKLLTDKVKLEDDNSGKEKVLVTVTSEAFGQVMFKNCRKKWLAVWKYKKAHGAKAKVPKYDKDDITTHDYEGLWSNPRSGQVEGGGWNMDGLQCLMDRMQAISAVRAADQENGYAKMIIARTLIQGAVKWKPENGGKRSATQANNAEVEGAVVKKRIKMVVLDE